MYTTFLACLFIMAQPPQKKADGIAFFKLVNTSTSSIEVELADAGKEFSQILKIEAGKNQFIAVKEGKYTCGIGNNKKEILVYSGQIVQVDLPYKAIQPEIPKEVPKEIPKKEIPKEVPKELPVKETKKSRTPKVEIISSSEVDKNQAVIELKGVPPTATIYIDNKRTSGEHKLFYTPNNLDPRYQYSYIIRCEVIVNSRIVDGYLVTVEIKGGHKTTVTFDFPPQVVEFFP